ncbi:integrase catalytic domain-containing protein [Trichonephila clavipes]|nr:integrase catalytic domain-containing protein [Trichonephila clavipes]
MHCHPLLSYDPNFKSLARRELVGSLVGRLLGEACEDGERALLRRTLGKAIFKYEELLTILCDCEKVVNSRPFTYMYEEMQDLTPITITRFLFEIPTAVTKDLDVRDTIHFWKRMRFRAKVIEELKG